MVLGSWSCRSGNSLDVFLGPADGTGLRRLELHWDSPPPLSAADQVDYDTRILPAIVRRAHEYLETRGRVLVVGG